MTITLFRKTTAALALSVAALVFALAVPAAANNLPSFTSPSISCSQTSASAMPALEVNRGGAPGWVYSVFYVYDSRTQRWTNTNWVASYGGQGAAPSWLLTNSGWVKLDHRGVTFRATAGSQQYLYELRYTQNAVMAHSNTWTTQWVYGGSCSTNVQQPW